MTDFIPVDPASLTAAQMNKLLSRKGRANIGPIPLEAKLAMIVVLLPAGFTAANKADYLDSVVAGTVATQAVWGTAHHAPVDAKVGHDVRLAVSSQLSHKPIPE